MAGGGFSYRQDVRASLAAGFVMLLAWLLSKHRCSASTQSSFAIGVVVQVVLHLLSACLSASQQFSAAAGKVATINWVVKLCCTIQCALCWGGPFNWQTMFSNSAFYMTSACSACLDFYQMQQGHHLHPYILAGMTTLQVSVLTNCVERSKHKLGLPTHGWMTSWALLMGGMVVGPRLADALLRWLAVHCRIPATASNATVAATDGQPAAAMGRPRSKALGGAASRTRRTCQNVEVDCCPEEGDNDCAAQPAKSSHVPCHDDNHVASGTAAARAAASGRKDEERSELSDMQGAQRVAHAAQGLPSCQSARILDAVQRVTLQQYRSSLGLRKQVAIKVSTTLQLHQLPSDLAAQLQAALPNKGALPRFQLLDMAARPGCILLTMDLLADADDSLQSHGEHGSALELEQHVRSLARTMLPCLLGLLPTTSQDRKQQHVAKHAQVLFCMGGSMLQASYESDSSSWTIQHAASHDDQDLSDSVYGLGHGSQQAELPLLLVQQGSCARMSLTGQAHSARPVAAASVAEGSGSLVHYVLLHITLLHPNAPTSNMTGPSHAAPVGWSAANAATLEWLKAAGPPQLLARCEGSYLSTKVTVTAGNQEDFSGSMAAADLQVEVQVPDNLLPRHHAGGPPVGLLPMVLELWQGVRCVSSTHVLLQTTPAAAAGNTAAMHAQHVWWWGTQGRTAQLAANELQQIGTQLQHAAVQEQHVASLQSWDAFMADFHTWLSLIREVCPAMPSCCLSVAHSTRVVVGTQLKEPALTPTALLQLGQDLAAYARDAGLNHLQRMLSQQQAVAQAWAAQKSVAAPVQHALATRHAAQHIKASLLGYACPACEARCRASMSQQLAVVQTYSSIALSGLGISTLVRYWNKPEFDPVWAPSIAITTTLWVTGVLSMYRRSQSQRVPGNMYSLPHASSTAGGTAGRRCGLLSVLLYASRVIPTLLYATGNRRINHAFTLLVKTRSILTHSIVLAFGEQLQVAVQLPFPGALLLMGVLEVVSNMAIAARLGLATPSYLVGLLLCNVCSSLLMDMRMRALITRGWGHACSRSCQTSTAENSKHGAEY